VSNPINDPLPHAGLYPDPKLLAMKLCGISVNLRPWYLGHAVALPAPAAARRTLGTQDVEEVVIRVEPE
jgi:hypothetical protein